MTLGIAIGDLLVLALGTGTAQLALVLAVAMVVAVLKRVKPPWGSGRPESRTAAIV